MTRKTRGFNFILAPFCLQVNLIRLSFTQLFRFHIANTQRELPGACKNKLNLRLTHDHRRLRMRIKHQAG